MRVFATGTVTPVHKLSLAHRNALAEEREKARPQAPAETPGARPGTEQYQRITLLKGYLRHLSGVCAKTAAWALNGHMVPGKSALPGRMGAEWDLRTGEELVRT